MNCSMRPSYTLAFAFALAFGCGPKSPGGEAEGASDSSDSDPGDGDPGDGDGDGDPGDGDGDPGDGDGDPGDGDGDSCEGYDDDFGPIVDVTVENTTDQPVYVAFSNGCDMQILLAAAVSGDPLPGLSDCWTCAGALEGNCVCPGPPCWMGAALKLDPGGSYLTAINATTYASRELPEACVDIDVCPTSCQQAEPWADGDYEIGVTVSDQVTCDGGGCDCDASVEGWCYIEVAGDLSGAPQLVTGTLTRPGDAPVTISIP